MDSLTFPEDFKIKTVSEFCAETKSGSTPSRTNNEYWENGTISWVSATRSQAVKSLRTVLVY